MGAYILVWPVISAAVLALIWIATIRETRAAREAGEEII
jgi:hypothetical protein